MHKRKPIKRLKSIKTNRIVLVDSEGRTRIVLDAGGKDGHASIDLFSKDGKSVQISSQPDGTTLIHILGKRGRIQIGLSANESGGIWISGKDGRCGTILGEEPGTSTHRLLLFKRGRHFWNTPSGKTKRRDSS